MDTGVKKMSLFEESFPEQSKKISAIQVKYTEAVRKADNNPEPIRRATLERNDALSDVADSILKADKDLRLSYPFKLTDEIISNLKNNLQYYENDKIVNKVPYAGKCISCGKSFNHGDLFVEECGSSVATCIDCCDKDVSIDGKKFRLCRLD